MQRDGGRAREYARDTLIATIVSKADFAVHSHVARYFRQTSPKWPLSITGPRAIRSSQIFARLFVSGEREINRPPIVGVGGRRRGQRAPGNPRKARAAVSPVEPVLRVLTLAVWAKTQNATFCRRSSRPPGRKRATFSRLVRRTYYTLLRGRFVVL